MSKTKDPKTDYFQLHFGMPSISLRQEKCTQDKRHVVNSVMPAGKRNGNIIY